MNTANKSILESLVQAEVLKTAMPVYKAAAKSFSWEGKSGVTTLLTKTMLLMGDLETPCNPALGVWAILKLMQLEKITAAQASMALRDILGLTPSISTQDLFQDKLDAVNGGMTEDLLWIVIHWQEFYMTESLDEQTEIFMVTEEHLILEIHEWLKPKLLF